MRTIKTILLIFLYNLSFGQDSILRLQSSKNPKKIVEFDNTYIITVKLVESDSSGKPIPTLYEGIIKLVRSNEILLDIEQENIKEVKSNSVTVNSTIKYSRPFQLNNEIRTIPINNIHSISHFTEKPISNVGGSIAGFSAFAALIVAPLISLNYKTGDFNQKIYYPALAICGTGFAIGVTLNVAFRKNRFYLINPYSRKQSDKNHWTIIPQT
jgi:hypothetical protein